ncbi:unnamed protein product [Knipowitschia caucasica]
MRDQTDSENNASTEDSMADQGDVSDGDSSEENSRAESEKKTAVALKELKVCVTDISLVHPDVVTNTPSGKRGRGRPKGSANKSNVNSVNSAKKRGRPKSSSVTLAVRDLNGVSAKRLRGHPKSAAFSYEDSFEDDSDSDESVSPPKKRGRPKGSFKKPKPDSEMKSDNEGAAKRGRGRPKGSFKKPKPDSEMKSDNEGAAKRGRGRPKKGPVKGKRGRPKKNIPAGAKREVTDGTKSSHKRPGRPKGSRNKPVVTVQVESTSGRPSRVHIPPDKLHISLPRKYPGKRGRPKKNQRGRPRKRPLPPEEELYLPRVWKALGRSRKYPREEGSEQEPGPETPRRGRGRPRKSEKIAHLKKLDSNGFPRKPGRPPKVEKEQDGPRRKRGRPKGSVKNKALDDSENGSDLSPESVPSEVPCPPEELSPLEDSFSSTKDDLVA